MPHGTKHLTTGQHARIQELYREGRSTRQIQESIGCTEHQARHSLKRHGLKPPSARGGACYRHADDVRRWAAEGVSLSEIGRRIGTTRRAVAKYLARHDIHREPFRQSGENNPAWKGGRMTDKQGYVLIHIPDHPSATRHGYVREHRLVMERTIGRLLNNREVVHHRNGNTSDNRPCNLELFASNGEHLAATLDGRCPEWTEDGLRRIEAVWRTLGERRRASSRARRSTPGDPPSPGTNARSTS